SSTLWGVLQDSKSFGYGLAANQIDYATCLHWGYANETGRCGCGGDGVTHRLSTSLLIFLDVTLEGLGWCEPAELVADHGVTNEIRENGRAARPGLDDLLGVCLVLSIHLVEEVLIYEWAFLKAAWHCLPPLSASCSDDDVVRSCCWSNGSGCGCDPPCDPKGILGDGHQKSYLHHHRVGGRLGS